MTLTAQITRAQGATGVGGLEVTGELEVLAEPFFGLLASVMPFQIILTFGCLGHDAVS